MDNDSVETDYNQPAIDEERLEEFVQRTALSDEDANTLRSITRLLVGGSLMGWDELLVHIRAWESEVQQEFATRAREKDGDEEGMVWPGDALARREQAAETLRHTLIGMLFESQDRFVKRSQTTLRLANRASAAMMRPFSRMMGRSRLMRPARDRFDLLVERGEKITNQWARRGRLEEARSRKLVGAATQETFDYSMDQLGQAPALQDLVRKQSAGLSQDVLDEVRKRTVTGDMLAESAARRLLRRAPRKWLPEGIEVEESQD